MRARVSALAVVLWACGPVSTRESDTVYANPVP